jgi:hypothetical protein
MDGQAKHFCEWAKATALGMPPRKKFNGWEADRTFSEEIDSYYRMVIDKYEGKEFILIVDQNRHSKSSGRCYYILVYTPKLIRPFIRY